MNKIEKKELRNIMVDLMTTIDIVSKKNSIKYIMGGGTLIGAVRHKGFIRWDDDIDIFVPRKDYDRLLLLLKNQNDVDWLSVIDENTEGYFQPFAKVVDNRTIIKSKSSILKHGVWVDVFPMENVPDDEDDRKKFLRRCQYYRALLLSMLTDFSGVQFGTKKLLKVFLFLIARSIGRKRLLDMAMKYMQKYNCTETKNMCITWSPYGREYVEKEMMDNIIDLDFEGRRFMAPAAYDKLLRRTFGNYMELPPENKRKNHEIIAYWK